MNPVCPYCRGEVGDAEGERQDCPGCGTPHHADCFAENGGCTVFGCANAPSDEAKVTVSATDMSGNVITRQAPAITPPITPTARPGLTLGAGFTTFHAPAFDPTPAPQQPASALGTLPPPPPPPLPGGTGVAPPPQLNPAPPAVGAPAPLVYYHPSIPPKSRLIFVLLGIFLGALGVHNFYAGYVKKGTIQLCLTVLSCFYGAAISWPWAIIEVCVINKDEEGTQFI